MKDIIERAKPLRRAKYVCMEGADKLASYAVQFHTSKANSALAQRLLRHICEAELGHGPKSRYHARPWNERGDVETRPW
jgi:hypothetical protein